MAAPGPGYYKYRCKYFQSHGCQNWVMVARVACTDCASKGRTALSVSPNIFGLNASLPMTRGVQSFLMPGGKGIGAEKGDPTSFDTLHALIKSGDPMCIVNGDLDTSTMVAAAPPAPDQLNL
ncbi:hypothetical protein MMC25_003507 [Agyrium rufum]|nr:hypothetical protein [Agyrium rufum]